MSSGKLRRQVDGLVTDVFGWATHVEPGAVMACVQQLRKRRPNASPRALAELIVRRTRMKSAAIGAATGLPANPWVAAGTGVLDAGWILRVHCHMVAQIGECYQPGFLDDPDAQTEILVAIFGARALSHSARKAAVLGGMGTTRQVIKRTLTGERLRAFRNWALKYFGRTVGQKTVITKTIPVIGLVIGAAWDFAETTVVGKRTIAYFENEEIVAAAEAQTPPKRARRKPARTQAPPEPKPASPTKRPARKTPGSAAGRRALPNASPAAPAKRGPRAKASG